LMIIRIISMENVVMREIEDTLIQYSYCCFIFALLFHSSKNKICFAVDRTIRLVAMAKVSRCRS
jgi:hypothetical protein